MGGRAIACLNSRDRNVLGFRRDLLTAAAYGVEEFLLVYGDRPDVGRRSDDVSVRRMMEEIRTFGGTDVFAGCAPFRVGATTRLTAAGTVQGGGRLPRHPGQPHDRRPGAVARRDRLRRADLRRRDGRGQRGDGPQAGRRERAAGRAGVARRRRRSRSGGRRRRGRRPRGGDPATTAASPAPTSSASAATGSWRPGSRRPVVWAQNRPGRPARAPDSVRRVLRIVLPKGSLEKATFELFEAADLTVVRSSASTTRRRSTTRASPRCASCARRRSRCTSPRACSTSASPAATGSRRPRSEVVSLGELQLLEGDAATRSAWSSPSPATRRSPSRRELARRRARLVGVPRADPALLRQARHRRRRPAVVRRQRGQGPRHRRLRRRDHRDRPGPARRRAADHRHHPRQLHRGDRQRRRPTTTRTSATPWAS